MKDNYGREINYLRISVTDLCNLRCRYCMPEEGVEKLCHRDILSLEEIYEIAAAAVELGVTKIRLTGGEPLVRRGITSLVEKIAGLQGLTDLAMTTNGLLLPDMARELRAAGLMRLNISLDTLDAEKYKHITRGGSLTKALDGIRAAEEAGFAPIKINAVLMGGFNDDEIPALCELTRERAISLRFIELMPIGHTESFGAEAYLSCSAVPERVPELRALNRGDGVAALYQLPGAKGTVGLIRPLSQHFCGECSRLRLTADGYLKPCLHSAEELSVRGLHGEELKAALLEAVAHKPMRHGNLSAEERSESARDMHRIGG